MRADKEDKKWHFIAIGVDILVIVVAVLFAAFAGGSMDKGEAALFKDFVIQYKSILFVAMVITLYVYILCMDITSLIEFPKKQEKEIE